MEEGADGLAWTLPYEARVVPSLVMWDLGGLGDALIAHWATRPGRVAQLHNTMAW